MSDSAGTTFTEVKSRVFAQKVFCLKQDWLPHCQQHLLLVSNFKLKAVCAALDTGFASSAVLSTLDKPTFDLLIPEAILLLIAPLAISTVVIVPSKILSVVALSAIDAHKGRETEPILTSKALVFVKMQRPIAAAVIASR
jgi:hypothetical protein